MAVTSSGFPPAGTLPRTRADRPAPRRWWVLVVIVLVLVMTGPMAVLGSPASPGPAFFEVPSASAAFSANGGGTGSARTGTLAPPTNVSVPATSTSGIAVSWAAPTGGPAPVSYYLTRTTGGVAAPACSTTPQNRVTELSCTDFPPTSGPHTYTVTAVHRSWTAVSVSSGSTSLAASKLAFTVQPTDVTAGGAMTPPVKVALQSAQGVAIPTADQLITLALGANPGTGVLSGTVSARTDANGVATFTGLNIDKTGTGYTLSASSTGLTSATSSTFLVASSRLVFTTATLTGPAASTASLGPMTIQRVDAAGTPVPAPAGGFSISLTSASTGTASFSTTRNGTPITTITIPSGSSTATFYYGNTRTGSATVQVSSNGTVSAVQTSTITAAPATKLVYTTPSASGPTSSTTNLGPITVQLQDTFSNPATAPAGGTPVTLSSTSNGPGVFSLTQGSATTVSSVSIPAGTSSVSFFYGDTTAGSPTITVSSTGLASATQTATVTAPVATQLAIITTAPTGMTASTANLGPVTVQLRDSAGNPVAAPAGGTALSITSTSTGTRTFSTTQGAATSSPVTIPAGSSTVSFFYGDTTAGSPTITVASAGLISATQTATVRAGTPARVIYTSAPVTGPAATTASLGPITVQLQDVFGNLAVAPTAGTPLTPSSSSTGTRIFSLTRGSSTGITSLTVPGGTSTITFYYGDTQAGSPTLTVTGTGLTPASQTQTITAAAPAAVQYLQPPTNVQKNIVFSPVITVMIVDRFGNRTTSTASVTVALRTTIGTIPLTGTLRGTTTVSAVSGLATFTNLTVGGSASGQYTLHAGASGLTARLSPIFTVT